MTNRWEQGKHLTLVNNDHLASLSNLSGDVIGPAAAWYELYDEAKYLVEEGLIGAEVMDRGEGVKKFLDRSLDLSRSVGARGLSTVADVLRAQEEASYHRDAGTFVPAQEQRRGGGLGG